MASDVRPPISFYECVDACLRSSEFMKHYRRLTGHALGVDARQNIERLIDEATGHSPPPVDEKEARFFFAFVRDYIWLPLQLPKPR